MMFLLLAAAVAAQPVPKVVVIPPPVRAPANVGVPRWEELKAKLTPAGRARVDDFYRTHRPLVAEQRAAMVAAHQKVGEALRRSPVDLDSLRAAMEARDALAGEHARGNTALAMQLLESLGPEDRVLMAAEVARPR